MFNNNKWMSLSGLIFASLLGASAAMAQDPACPYNLASLQGTYATVTPYGANLGMAIGVRILDGKGNDSRTFLSNVPLVGSTSGQRNIVTGTNRATYKVNCDGSGTTDRVLTASDGTISFGTDDFLIIKSVLKDGQLIATEIQDTQRIPAALGPGGVFATRHFYRRPDTAGSCYTLESLQGSYAVVNTYDANVAIGLQAEILDGKGNLTRTGVLNQPNLASTTGARTIGTVTSRGTYKVNCNGTGTITRIVTRPDGTTASADDDFVITGAIEKEGKFLATSLFDIQRDPSVILPNGSFLTRAHTLRESPDANAVAQLESRLQSLACGTTPPAVSCQTTVNIWNYYLTFGLGSVAPPLIVGDGSRSLTVKQYLEARAAAGL